MTHEQAIEKYIRHVSRETRTPLRYLAPELRLSRWGRLREWFWTLRP